MSDRFGVDLGRLASADTPNAALSWTAGLALLGLAAIDLSTGGLAWGLVTLLAAGLAVAPGLFYRTLTTTLPWELVALVALAAGWRLLDPAAALAPHALVAGTAILLAADLHCFTATRLSHRFVVVLVALATVAVTGGWALLAWGVDGALGTDYLTTNAALMAEFAAAALTGLIAGLAFDVYVRYWEGRLDRFTPALDDAGGGLR